MITVRHNQSERAGKAFQENREALIRFWCNADKGIYLSLKNSSVIASSAVFLVKLKYRQLFGG
jgi:adenosine/AMP kinase